MSKIEKLIAKEIVKALHSLYGRYPYDTPDHPDFKVNILKIDGYVKFNITGIRGSTEYDYLTIKIANAALESFQKAAFLYIRSKCNPLANFTRYYCTKCDNYFSYVNNESSDENILNHKKHYDCDITIDDVLSGKVRRAD